MTLGDFTEADLPALDRLQPADWNLILPYYNYYLQHDNCSALKLTNDDEISAIGAVIRHEDSAWLAHIVVDVRFRNIGLGKLITKALISSIDSQLYSSIYLMATPLGHPVYKSLGFVDEGLQSFYRWEDTFSYKDDIQKSNLRPIQKEDYEQVLSLDHFISGESRAYRLLDGIESGMVTSRDGIITGFYLPDVLEGPVFAINEDDGMDLIKYRLKQKKEAIVPDENIKANDYLKAIGMTKYRYATRMRLGKERKYNAFQVFNRYSGQIG